MNETNGNGEDVCDSEQQKKKNKQTKDKKGKQNSRNATTQCGFADGSERDAYVPANQNSANQMQDRITWQYPDRGMVFKLFTLYLGKKN